ncbi:MAG: hypothetical protein DCC75_02065 [Proteobacteria bacterium]|nr:MAG: hypothetical protein DCC75_02065 [Pseudomonadota bacterium]
MLTEITGVIEQPLSLRARGINKVLLWGRSKLKLAAGALVRLIKAQAYLLGLMWREELGLFFLCIGLGAAQGISVPLFSYALGEALEIAGGGSRSVNGAMILLCLSVAGMGVVPMLTQVLNRELVEWLFGHIQGRIISKVASLDPERFGEPELKGAFQRLSMRLVWKLIEFSFSLYPLIKGSVGAAIALVLLLRGAPELLVVVGLSVVPAMLVEANFARRYFEADESCTGRLRSFWDGFHLGTTATSVLFRQAIGAAVPMAKEFNQQLQELVGVYRRCNQYYARWRVLAALLSQLSVAFSLLALVRQYAAGELGISETVLLIGAVSLLGSSLAEAAAAVGQQCGLSLYVRDWLQFLQTQPWVERAASAPALPDLSKGASLELRGLKFAYSAGRERKSSFSEDSLVLKGISLSIRAGEKCALLAPNGSGKTTLSNLIAGLFNPSAGEIRIAGIPLGEFDEVTLRRIVAYLPQDFSRYTMTVERFIALGCADQEIDPQRVRLAAERSGASSFIAKWPQSYQTLLGHDYEGGESPSGGQLQKLVLAMMFYKNAPLMVLDEPTAAVDPESAREFWDHLFHECPGHTVIFSTHYLGAVRRADKIILLADGRIAEVGTHAELIRHSTTYQRIFRSQADDFTG